MSLETTLIPLYRNFNNDLWVSMFVLISLLLISYVNQRGGDILSTIKMFFSSRLLTQFLRSESKNSYFTNNILLINSFITISLTLFFYLLPYLDFLSNNLIIFLFLFLSVMIWYIINLLVNIVLSKVSGIKYIDKEFSLYNKFFFQILGFFLLPGVIGLYFFPNNFYGYNLVNIAKIYVIAIVLILLLNKLIQSIYKSFEIKISWIYIFLYICTLEILPLCVGFQLIIN